MDFSKIPNFPNLAGKKFGESMMQILLFDDYKITPAWKLSIKHY